METLRCVELQKTFDGTHALAGVSIDFPVRGITAIIGPNGAGKTTLVDVLTGFVQPDAGRCFLGQQEIQQMAPYRIARLGIARTFQDLALIHRITVVENVLLGRPSQRGEQLFYALLRFGVMEEETANRKRALQLLEFVGLQDKAQQLAGELSYGEQKLLSLACCLATEAEIVLLDEPVAGVHSEMASRILRLMQQLKQDGKVVIFIEHDISAVRLIADTVIVMDQGKIIARGSPSEVLERPEIIEAYFA